MAEPIVFISRNRITPGRAAEFASAYGHAVELIGASRPRTALFAAYVDDAETEVRIVHAFPDAAALTAHFEGSSERARSASDLIAPLGFEVFGHAPEAAVEQLRAEASAVGVGLVVLPQAIGGFLRRPT